MATTESKEEVTVEPVENSDAKVDGEPLKSDEDLESTLRTVDQQIEAVSGSWAMLRDIFHSSIETLKQLLDEKEKMFEVCVTSARDSKLKALTQYKEMLVARDGDTKPAELASPPLLGGVACGFVPEFSTLTLATTSLITHHCEPVRVGGSVAVSVIGGMSQQATFWARLLPNELTLIEDVMLQNISNCLQMQLERGFVPLSSPSPGDYCAARYSQDQRWYRGRVTAAPKKDKVSVFFIDYGNTEEVPPSNLAPLDDGFLVFPPQMIRCCFSADQTNFPREAKWKFTDLTHNQNLIAHLLQRGHAPPEDGGVKYVVRLIDESAGQPFDIGATVMALADVSQQGKGAIIRCRDIRYKDKPLPPNARQIISTSAQPHTVTETTPTEQPSVQSEESEQQTNQNASSPTGNEVPLVENTIPCSSVAETIPPSITPGPITEATPVKSEQVKPPSITPSPVEEASGPVTNGVDSEPLSVVMETEVGSKVEEETKVEKKSASEESKVEKKSTREGSLPPLDLKKSVSDFESSVPVLNGDIKNCLDTLHPNVKQGAELTLIVTTDLEQDGTFWASLESSQEYDTMLDQLHTSTSRLKEDQEYTPVFFSTGDCCIAQYSEDDSWSRARIEAVKGQEFSVRYLDFGNQETRPLPLLAALKKEFSSLPPLAVKCSLANEDNQDFKEEMRKKFNELFSTDCTANAHILEIREDIAYVRLTMTRRGKTIDLSEEVYSTGFLSEVKGLYFSLPLSIEDTSAMATSWADQMDDIASPVGDGLTLMGAEGERFKSPSPVPQVQRSTEARSPWSDPEWGRRSPGSDRIRRSRDKGRETKSIESAKPIKIKKRPASQDSRGSSPGPAHITRDSSLSSSPQSVKSDTTHSREMGSRQPRVNTNAIKSYLQGGRGKGVGPAEIRTRVKHSPGRGRGSTQTTPTPNRSPSPWNAATDDQVRLFVKNIPDGKSKSQVIALFAAHGEVLNIEKDRTRPHVCYVTMPAKDADKAMKALNGKALDRDSKPLYIDTSNARSKR